MTYLVVNINAPEMELDEGEEFGGLSYREHETRADALADFEENLRSELPPVKAAPMRRALAAHGTYRHTYGNGTEVIYSIFDLVPPESVKMGPQAYAGLVDRLHEIMTDPTPPVDHPERYWWRMEVARLMYGAVDSDVVVALGYLTLANGLPDEFRDAVLGGWLEYITERRGY